MWKTGEHRAKTYRKPIEKHGFPWVFHGFSMVFHAFLMVFAAFRRLFGAGASSKMTCKACEKGTYQPILAAGEQALCIPCAVGNFTDKSGQSSCDFCPKGRGMSRKLG